MRILLIDGRNKVLKIVPEILDDLWHLERIIEEGDLVSGSTTRKIKGEGGKETLRVKMFLTIEIEKAEFHKDSGTLRVNGVITEGKPEEYVDLKAHHSLEIELGKTVKIQKKNLAKHHIERLEKAKAATHKAPVLLIAMDDESAHFAFLKEFSLDAKASIRSHKSGKMLDGEEGGKKYFSEMYEKILEYKAEKVIVAGPGFTKNDFNDFLKEKNFKGRVYAVQINNVGITGLNELLKSGAIEKITEEMQILKETKLVERIFEELGKNSGLAEYGVAEVKKAIEYGAVEYLLVIDSILFENREELEELMKKTETSGGKVHIVSNEHEAGEKLSSLGGIAAVLRYAVK